MDFFRYLSRHAAPGLRIDISTGTGRDAGNRANAGPSVDWRSAEYSSDVYGDDLDAAGLDGAGMGTSRRLTGVMAVRALQLLDEQLLGRLRRCDRRRPGPGCTTASFPTSPPAQCHCIRFGSSNSCDEPSRGRVSLLYSVGGCPFLVDSSARNSRALDLYEANTPPNRRNPGLCCRICRLLQLARHRKPDCVSALHRTTNGHDHACFLVATRQASTYLCKPTVRCVLQWLDARPLSKKFVG